MSDAESKSGKEVNKSDEVDKAIPAVTDDGDDIDVEGSSDANAADALKAQQKIESIIQISDSSKERPERPKSNDSSNSISSSNSIPPLPPLPTSTSSRIPQRRPVICSLTSEKNKFSISNLAVPSEKKGPHLLQKRTLCKSYSDGIFQTGSASPLQPDKDSHLIGVTHEHPIGPLCVIRRNVQFDNDDSFIKSFQLYWYVDAQKGCLESPILNNRRLHGQSIESPYFVITKNQRRHQAYSCTFCKGKTTFTTVLQAIRHLKANHRHNVKVLVQDPKGVFHPSPAVHTAVHPPIQMPITWPLARNFSHSIHPGPTVSTLLPVTSATTLSATICPYNLPQRPSMRRSTSDIPSPEALENTNMLTEENMTYLKGILTTKLGKKVEQIEARGGCSVTVTFADGKSRVVRLANEGSSATSSPSAIEKSKVIRTVSATANPSSHYGIHDSLKIPGQSTKSKYAAKMNYINKKNEIDTANTSIYKTWSTGISKTLPGDEASSNGFNHEPTERTESPQEIKDGAKTEPHLHGNSIEPENSPTFKVCDNNGPISEQQTFKMRLEKQKPEKGANPISFLNGELKMDNVGQYFNTFIKVQVLALNHQCTICSHATETEREMADHIQEHSLKELVKFA